MRLLDFMDIMIMVKGAKQNKQHKNELFINLSL